MSKIGTVGTVGTNHPSKSHLAKGSEERGQKQICACSSQSSLTHLCVHVLHPAGRDEVFLRHCRYVRYVRHGRYVRCGRNGRNGRYARNEPATDWVERREKCLVYDWPLHLVTHPDRRVGRQEHFLWMTGTPGAVGAARTVRLLLPHAECIRCG